MNGLRAKTALSTPNFGKDTQANWYLNLKKDPHASVEVDGRIVPVMAREARGGEYERRWQFATGRHPPYREYQKMTTRHIPIMVFEREDGLPEKE